MEWSRLSAKLVKEHSATIALNQRQLPSRRPFQAANTLASHRAARRAQRCVIHGRVSIWPDSIRPMIRGKVRRQGVARAEQCPFGPVKGRVPEANFFAGEADEDEPAAVGDQAKCGRHRLRIAGRIDHHVGQIAAGDFAQLVVRADRTAAARAGRAFAGGRSRAAAGLRSTTIAFAPVSLTNSSVARPIGPAPMIRHVSSPVRPLRLTAWQPMASVSTRASCSNDRAYCRRGACGRAR